MSNKLIKFVVSCILTIGIGITIQANTVHANVLFGDWTNFRDSWMDYGINQKTVKAHNAYIWNLSHTKRIHNLNNYKNTTWYTMMAFTRTKSNKGPIYYKISNGTNITGVVYNKYLTKYYAEEPKTFQTDDQYLHYLKTAPSQKLARGVMRLFPNSHVSLKLSQIASDQYDSGNETLVNADYTDVQTTLYRNAFSVLEAWQTKKTATQRIAIFEKYLNSIGYDQAKRDSMSDYQLGLFIRDGVGIGQPSTQLPIEKTTDDAGALSYQVLLAKEK
ncbi:hypothetical protein [Lentilactobacillus farraginis]|uniref:D-alanyl-D-alanine carboxypeptidase n=1 Tax=Lentilactobacillus farraginis DSM 18382 = JCM 14108 TaxID=1423743 RepID=X0PGW7_9LACO|nr:hypothetical protein [Lentilactobacillus farraginis]KRM10893.1 D-alanyl-D-alanine carboxypeptidase [Lentilactobacillus farraginis DSM 18382 = JCM 14108]GAF36237.1 D-alanyl-D-alanine carboxypeptidase [Lentilactobacillus farraginis DSM 18382 = JCM 14108]